MAVANPPPLVPIAGARAIGSGQISAQPAPLDKGHWMAPSRGIIPIVFFLIIAAPRGFNNSLFQEVYCKAMQNRSRPTTGAVGGLREGCSAAPMGQGVGRVWRPPAPRVERARPADPSSTSF